MNTLMIVLRLVHVVSGALWVGMMAFTVFFLTPAIRDAGPEGGKVMAALQRRGVMTVVPILALGTLVSGMWLFSRFSGGSPAAALTTPVGLAFGLGGLVSLIAFVLGLAVMRPAMARANASTDPVEIQRLRAHSAAVGRVVALLLILAVAAMAVARYL